METQNRNSRRCDVCIFDVHRASFVKHLKKKKHIDNEKIVPTDFFNKTDTTNITIQKIYNPKTLRDIVREQFKIDEKKLNKELVKK